MRQPLPLTIILYYKCTLQLYPISEYKLLVYGLMISESISLFRPITQVPSEYYKVTLRSEGGRGKRGR